MISVLLKTFFLLYVSEVISNCPPNSSKYHMYSISFIDNVLGIYSMFNGDCYPNGSYINHIYITPGISEYISHLQCLLPNSTLTLSTVTQQVKGSSLNVMTLEKLMPGTTHNITIRAYQDILGPASKTISVQTLSGIYVREFYFILLFVC